MPMPTLASKRLSGWSRHACGGFTLIEMLIVMAIVALLLTIALPNYFSSINKSKEVVLRENLRVLRVSLDKFLADTGHYPQSLNELVEQRYLRGVPMDPITESSQTWITVEAKDREGREDRGIPISGIADVKSGAPGVAGNGHAYASF
jgi:general secretion pathway protein G